MRYGASPESAIVERDVLAFLETKRQPSVSPMAQRVAEQAGDERRIIHASLPQRLLEPGPVVIPFADRLSFPSSWMRTRRLFAKTAIV